MSFLQSTPNPTPLKYSCPIGKKKPWKARLTYMINMPSSDLLHSIRRLYPLKSAKNLIYIHHKPFAVQNSSQVHKPMNTIYTLSIMWLILRIWASINDSSGPCKIEEDSNILFSLDRMNFSTLVTHSTERKSPLIGRYVHLKNSTGVGHSIIQKWSEHVITLIPINTTISDQSTSRSLITVFKGSNLGQCCHHK